MMKTVDIPVEGRTAVLTRSVPMRRGHGSPGAVVFSKCAVAVRDGVVRCLTTEYPTFVEVQNVRREPYPNQDDGAPFGILPASATPMVPEAEIADAGITHLRYAGAVMSWDRIERQLGVDYYDWEQTDQLVEDAKRHGQQILFTVKSYHSGDQGPMRPDGPHMPEDLSSYLVFLRTAVRRYGDDVSAWQIENEVDGPFWGDTPENYARLLDIAYSAIKDVNRDLQVVMAGASGPRGFNRFYRHVLHHHPRFDAVDLHWYGAVGEYEELQDYNFKGFLGQVRGVLSDLNYDYNLPIWITETGTYGGHDVVGKDGSVLPEQTERDQAAELVRRFVYFIGNGVERVYWYGMREVHHGPNVPGLPNDYFENVGLINNPANVGGESDMKIGYYSYQQLIGMLQGVRWGAEDAVKDISADLDSDGAVCGFAFRKAASTVYVVWMR